MVSNFSQTQKLSFLDSKGFQLWLVMSL